MKALRRFIIDSATISVRPSGREHHAVGEAESVGHHLGRAIRLDADEHGGTGWGATHEIEPEIAHPGPAVVMDEHLVQVPRGQSGQVSMLDE